MVVINLLVSTMRSEVISRLSAIILIDLIFQIQIRHLPTAFLVRAISVMSRYMVNANLLPWASSDHDLAVKWQEQLDTCSAY